MKSVAAAALCAFAVAHRTEDIASLAVDEVDSSSAPPLQIAPSGGCLNPNYCNQPFVFEIQERARFTKQNEFDIFIQEGGQLTKWAEQKGHGLSSLGSVFMDPSGTVLSRQRVARGMTIASADKTWMTPPGKAKDPIHYTFTQVNAIGQNRLKSNIGGFKQSGWKEEVFIVDQGWCEHEGGCNMVAYAKCDMKAIVCNIFDKNQQPLAKMEKIHQGIQKLEKVERYRISISGGDAVMLAQFGAFIDLSNNREAAREAAAEAR
jgi:organic radical activating enzyme